MSILLTSSQEKKPKKRVRFNLDHDDKEDDDQHHHKKLTTLQIAHRRNVLGSKDMFLFNYGTSLQIDNDAINYKMKLKIQDEFIEIKNHPLTLQQSSTSSSNNKRTFSQSIDTNHQNQNQNINPNPNTNNNNNVNEPPKKKRKTTEKDKPAINPYDVDVITENNINSDNTTIIQSIVDNSNQNKNKDQNTIANQNANNSIMLYNNNQNTMQIQRRVPLKFKKKLVLPEWHRPWKLYRVIPGHLGWVESIAVDPSNEWFCTGSSDRTIKIWNLASGELKLTLTGHISHVRGLAISHKHPYMFSCGEDKQVRCWDLEINKVIRHYHGHLSGVYCLDLHPTLNILFTGGRDSTCRVWDIRTKTQIMVLTGHKHTVHSLCTQSSKPQIITGSHDKTIRCWDLRNNGRALTVLTNHKKSIRALKIHPNEYTFVSGAADNIKTWKCPNGDFLRNMNQKPLGIVETLSINQDNVVISGLQNGYLKFWDYKTGYKFQEMKLGPQPGSLDSEAGILASTFDITGTRLITCEADKTIKMFKEDMNATIDSHPIDFKPNSRTRY